jgi:glycerophosphoryl diester phosphodiesterase
MIIIAHRGASALAPENTLRSVNLAWEMESDASEIDVYMTADHRIMVMHDETTSRTGGVPLVIAESSSTVLRKLDVGKWKGPEFAGEPVPYLEEVLATIPPARTLFVEVKCGKEIAETLRSVIESSGKRDQVVLISFGLDTIAECKKVMPDIPACWLRGTVKDKETGKYIPHSPDLIAQARAHNLDGMDVHYAGLDMTFADSVREAGMKLYVWTVNDPSEAKRVQALGCDGLTTDWPDLMRKPRSE